MIRIDASTLYTRTDLAELLKDSGVDVDHFIGRIKCRKVFRMLWLGADILEAIKTAPALAEREDPADPLPAIPARRRGRPPKQHDKVVASDGKTRLIGGMFRPEDLGISPK
jgi:hypothetical protein